MYRRKYSTAGDMDRSDRDWSDRTEEKTYFRWINEQLKNQELAVDDIATGFQDGVKLIVLLEVLSKKSLHKYNKEPGNIHHKMANLDIALAFIREEGIRQEDIG